MKILVTGGAGYIGSVLVHWLLTYCDHDVTVLDNFRHGQQTLYHLCRSPHLNIIKGDVRDKGTMEEAMKEADVIIPLAAIVGKTACEQDRLGAVSINCGAIDEMLNLRSSSQAVIYPCTNSGYGVGEPGIYCTEETPLRPLSLYGGTKAESESAIMSRGNAISLRLATVFGCSPRMRYDLLVNNLVYRAVTDGFVVLYQGEFMRNYIHVFDVARAFEHCLSKFDTMKDQVYNVGNTEANMSKRDLCFEIKKQVPDFFITEAPIGMDPDQRNYIVSNAKIENTQYKAAVSLQEGIAELIKGYSALISHPVV